MNLTATLIGQFGSFTLSAVIGGTGIALFSQSTLIHRLQWTTLPSPELKEEPSSGQSCNRFIINIISVRYKNNDLCSANGIVSGLIGLVSSLHLSWK